jgi:RNA polymerase sigma-70 factor (ECF subfamily)
MAGDKRSDVELLRAARVGDGEAFGEFYRRHHALVLAFVGRRVGNPEVAADLLAETFAAGLVAVLDWRRETPPEPVAWLLTIARNKLIDSVRRGRVERAARTRLGLPVMAVDDDELRRIDELIDRTDVAVRLAENLPAEQFEALRARILDEEEYREIARALQCSEAVVRKRVSRALRTLRAAMEAAR